MGDWYLKQTIGRLPERAARQWGPREALAFQGRRGTFAEVHARVDAMAKGLLSLGIAPGDKVALWMVNRPEWIDAMFAIIKIGAVLVPVNTRFRTEDMAYILAQSDAAAVLLAERSGPVDYLGMMREVVPALGSRPDPRFPCLRHLMVLSDRADADVTDWREVLDRGFYTAFSIYPSTKMGNERMTEIVRQYGPERIIVDSACDWGVSDPLAVPKTAMLMAQRGIPAQVIRQVTYDNALAVYGFSGTMSETDWLDPAPIDQRGLFEGNSVLRGGQTPRIEPQRRSFSDLRIS